MPPLVSIGMPVYNGARYIREALDSLLGQTFTDFELIISDNASTDSTEAICREYAAKDQRIRYIRQSQNLGASGNFKFVLDEALGEYFMWAAHDDRWDRKFVEMMVQILDSDSKAGLAFCDVITRDIINGIDKSYYSCGFTVNMRKIVRYLFRLINGCPNLIYGLFRRNILITLPIYQFDYYDIYLTHWFELESLIKVIPLPLFIAGVKGERLPYSLTDTLINYRPYLKEEYNLLKKHFEFPIYLILFIFSWYLIRKTTKVHNTIIINANKCIEK
jgi:glycosyltransferase involved in cell wall biosynthesis